jgi:hypothetical protein
LSSPASSAERKRHETARLAELTATVLPGSSADYRKLIADDTEGERWSSSRVPGRIDASQRDMCSWVGV